MDDNDAAIVTPAYESEITVTSVTAGAATAAITIATSPSAYTTITIDDGAGGGAVGAYLTAKNGSAPADPDPTATSGTGRTQWYSADALAHVRFAGGDQIKLYVPGSGTYYVREHRSSP